MTKPVDLGEIFSLFRAGGTFLSGERYGSGHIHETYRVRTSEQGSDEYILQKLNTNVFPDIPSLQGNIERVTRHIQEKLRDAGEKDIRRKCLTLIPARKGGSWCTDRGGSYWRMYLFISDHRSYDLVDSPAKAFQGGKAIGKFQAQLADLPARLLDETIPRFHDIEARVEAFKRVVSADPAGRVAEVAGEIAFVLEREKEMKKIIDLGRKGLIPLRITHNDTKFNNVLLDNQDRALCVIDLDTVMPGYVHYDFGDAIRTAANRAAEDEKVLELVGIDLDLYRGFAMGYLEEMRNTLNNAEIETLHLSPPLITFIIGLRFLTDYLDGDRYFRIHSIGHNLQRARAQFRLVESMEKNEGKMKEIISDLCC